MIKRYCPLVLCVLVCVLAGFLLRYYVNGLDRFREPEVFAVLRVGESAIPFEVSKMKNNYLLPERRLRHDRGLTAPGLWLIELRGVECSSNDFGWLSSRLQYNEARIDFLGQYAKIHQTKLKVTGRIHGEPPMVRFDLDILGYWFDPDAETTE
jgi:hypothetical protein